ncbi:MAG: hypothetical protein RIA64_01505 [Rhodospirillales bacterium]
MDPLRLPEFRPDDIEGWADELVRTLEQYMQGAAQTYGEGYMTSNVTTTRTLDADSVTLDQLADVVGTVINDLTNAGRFKN